MYWQGPPAGPFLPELDVDPPARQRRLTVLFRWLILIPQFIVAWFLSIGAMVVVIIGWFGALFMGQLPAFAWTYLSFYLEYAMRVSVYAHLLVDRYPPFAYSAPGYPVQVDLPPPGPLNRLAVLFRYFLALPVLIVTGVLQIGWGVCAFFIWLIVLVLGRMPDALFRATAAMQRFELRTGAYWFMLTPQYPSRLFGDGDATAAAAALTGYPGAAPLPGQPFPGQPDAAPLPGAPVAGQPPQPEDMPGSGLPSAPPLRETWTGDQWATSPAAYGENVQRSATRPLLMTGAARGLLILFIVLGAIGYITEITYTNVDNNNNHNHGVNVYVNNP